MFRSVRGMVDIMAGSGEMTIGELAIGEVVCRRILRRQDEWLQSRLNFGPHPAPLASYPAISHLIGQ
jgi:hypothetical protein